MQTTILRMSLPLFVDLLRVKLICQICEWRNLMEESTSAGGKNKSRMC